VFETVFTSGRCSQLIGWALVVSVAMTGCGDGSETPLAEPTGPPTVQDDVVRDHGEQFDTDVPDRPAGSQEELAASTYLTGHLQLAGYLVFLDGVPVKDLVRSTNVVARPPSGKGPTIALTVAYDTSKEFPSDGDALGLFLELARALNVATPNHSVSFVALGAEHVDLADGNLGSRRAAKEWIDDDAHPIVLSLGQITEGACVTIEGDAIPGLATDASLGGCDELDPTANQPDVFAEAGFEHVTISGDPSGIGVMLLGFLSAEGR
jgi:hypothetical protein